ncbi:O-antigen polysaccharide polymerase Wzy, partial [Turicibacter sanguinis]|nr:O-antigen polysaccharide polymerase Wzy [Turicibacter sanguinis]
MNLKIQRKKITCIIIYVFYLLLLTMLLFFKFTSLNIDSGWNEILFFTLISHIIVTYTLLIYLKFEFNSISFIFITLSYIFHFGQLIVKNINRDHLLIFDVSTVVPLDIFIKSNIFSLFILSAVSVGCMCAKKTNYQLRKQTNNKKKISNKKIILLGIIILLTSFPLDIFFTIKKILVANQSGYLDVLGVESSGILSQFARFHLIGVALIIMGFSDRPKKSIFIFILYAIYSLVVMMTGSRIYPVVSLLILGLILLKSINKKLSIKVILILSIPAFL